MLFGMHITTFLGCIVIYISGTYLLICKVTQQTLSEMIHILEDIQYQTTIGRISLMELALMAKGDNASEISEMDIPEGLIKLS